MIRRNLKRIDEKGNENMTKKRKKNNSNAKTRENWKRMRRGENKVEG